MCNGKTMRHKNLPSRPNGHEHVLVLEEAEGMFVLAIHDEESNNHLGAIYFTTLPEDHLLVKAITRDNKDFVVTNSELRKTYGVPSYDFKTL